MRWAPFWNRSGTAHPTVQAARVISAARAHSLTCAASAAARSASSRPAAAAASCWAAAWYWRYGLSKTICDKKHG